MKRRNTIEALLKESSELSPSPHLKEEILTRAKAITPDLADCKKTRFLPRLNLRRLATLATVLVLIIATFLGGNLTYHESYQSVFLDINPSIELIVNRFDTVNSVIYHNDDAEALFESLTLTGMPVEDSVATVLDCLQKNHYLDEEREIYLTVASKKKDKSEKLLKKLMNCAQKHATEKGYRASFHANALSKEEIKASKEYGISPPKYQLISSIIDLDPSYTVDSLADKKMKELREILKELLDS